MRESVIERYLHAEVVKHGGTTRKFSSAHRPNNPDRIVVWPGGMVHFLECKAPGQKPRPGQRRELNRLRKMGCSVRVVSSKESVDHYVTCWKAK